MTTRSACARPRARQTCSLATAVVVLALAGCNSSQPQPDQPTTRPSVQQSDAPTGSGSAAPEPTSDPQDVPTSGATPSRAPDPAAPRTFTKVGRPGRSAGSQIAVSRTSSDRARWDDGVTVRLDRVTSSTASGRGPGSLNGAPLSTLGVTVTNGSATTVDLSRVVLTVPYGSGTRRLAQQVYTDQASDFSGQVRAGGTARATYAFSIPVKQRPTADLVVDLDDRHALATLDGVTR